MLLKAGADTEKKSIDGSLAIELAPDTKVKIDLLARISGSVLTVQIMNYIIQNAELEGIELTAPRP